jgi:hypothetical protein
MHWHRQAATLLMFTDKPAFLSESKFDKPTIANDDTLESKQFIEIERPSTGFANGPAPSLDTILRRRFSFNRIAGFGIFQQ